MTFPNTDHTLPFPAWGHLGIRAYDIDADHNDHREPMTIRCWRIFSALLDTKEGKELVSRLEQDRRVNELNGKMISSGSGASRFDVKNLAMWFLWLWNRSSKETADTALERFLDDAEIDVLALIGLEGISTKKTMQLMSNFRILPVEELPECGLKDEIYRERFSHTLFNNKTSVDSFLAGQCNVPKVSELCNDRPNFDSLKDLWTWFGHAYDRALLLNCLRGIASLPSFQTTLVSNESPFGPFGGSGGGKYFHGRRADHVHTHDSIDETAFATLVSGFESKSASQKDSWRMVLTRLAFAKTAIAPTDAALELGIAIEMMLQHDNANRDQLSLAFRLRGAWLLEPADATARRDVYDKLKLLYNCRSEVAHTGNLTQKNRDSFESDRTHLNEIGERIAQQLLTRRGISWDDVILASVQDAEPSDAPQPRNEAF